MLASDALNRLSNMVDAVGTTKYAYTAGNQLLIEDGPFASDTVTNTYVNRLRTSEEIGNWLVSELVKLSPKLLIKVHKGKETWPTVADGGQRL